MSAIRNCLVLIATLVALHAPGVRAEIITLGTSPGGSGGIYHAEGFNIALGGPINTYTSSKPLTSIESYYSDLSTFGSVTYTSVGYLLFDLSTVPFNAQQASIQFDVASAPAGTVSLVVIDGVSLEYLTLLQNNAVLGTTVGSQVSIGLISGGIYVQRANPTNGGVLTFPLDAAAIQSINNASGLWGVSIVYAGQTPPGGLVQQPSIRFNSPVQLVLNDQPALPPGC